jgi:hypothetical protein
MFGMFPKRTACFCSKASENWSWPFTRSHELYHGVTVTTVFCMKHPWSVRLYDFKKMRFVKVAEERKILRQIRAKIAQPPNALAHTVIAEL